MATTGVLYSWDAILPPRFFLTFFYPPQGAKHRIILLEWGNHPIAFRELSGHYTVVSNIEEEHHEKSKTEATSRRTGKRHGTQKLLARANGGQSEPKRR